ncbi:MAG: NAD(+) synthase [Bacilli bacterium]
MRNQMIKVGCAVPKLKIANVDFNSHSIISLIRKNRDCSILVFPELSLTGYSCGDLFFQQALLDRCLDALIDIASATIDLKGMTVVIGLPVRFRNSLYNCAAYLSQGEILGIVPKINIPNYGEFYERRWFASGKDILSQSLSVKDELIPFGCNLLFEDEKTQAIISTDICEDLWVMDKPSTKACMAGSNITVNLSASDETISKDDYRRNLVSMQSGSCYSTYIYCSSGMDESSTDLVFSGHCLIANNGSLLNETIFPKSDSVIKAIIDLKQNEYNRLHQSTFDNFSEDDFFDYLPCNVQPLGGKPEIKASELSALLSENHYAVSKTPFVPENDLVRKERCQEILRIQANGLATRVRNTGIKNLVIGVSGGLDSTLALLVCQEAKKLVPDISILGYTMPNKGNTSSLTYHNSIDLMVELGIKPQIVPIDEGVKVHLADIGHSDKYEGSFDTAYENAQARYRTYILMDCANMNNGLVVGTGDLSELALGWCTYNGDHMSMYAVNTSIPKTLVKYIVETYALTLADDKLKKVLLSIVDTPITPELTPTLDGEISQKTEEKIGKYDLNDFFLYYHLRFASSPEMIMALACVAYPHLDKSAIKEALIRFYKRFYSQQFKRSCLPDGPKVGSVTLSPRGDYRMPSDADVSMIISLLEKC